METDLLTHPDRLYDALLARDEAYDGRAYVGVETTGIFCRLTCPARKPKRENCRFFGSVGECLEAGFRACKRCTPLAAGAEAEPIVQRLLDAMERDPQRRWSEDDVVAEGLDPSTVRRAFRRHFGITFLEMARLARLRSGAETLAAGGSVIEAQLDAGFESGSGFRAAFARVLGRPPAEIGEGRLRADWIETLLGPMLAVADPDVLHLLEFFDRKGLPAELRGLLARHKGGIAIGRHPPIDRIAAELTDYFAGRAATFATPLAQDGGDFTRGVWAELRRIPPGTSVSYGALARALDRPTASRAVARANGANPLAIVVPCHRVIGGDGSLTGYAGGLWRKRWLLDHERRHFAPPPDGGNGQPPRAAMSAR